MGMFDFLAGSAPDDPRSYPAMEARRKIALQLLTNSKKGYPKNIGEGLTSIGDAIGDRAVMNQLARQESAYQKYATEDNKTAVPEEATTVPAVRPRRVSDASDQTDGPPIVSADAAPVLPAPSMDTAQSVMAAPPAAYFPSPSTAQASALPPSLPPTSGPMNPVQASQMAQLTGPPPATAASSFAPTAALNNSAVQSDAAPPPGASLNPAVRNSIAQTLQTLAARGALPAQGVPQQNPTLGAGSVPPAAMSLNLGVGGVGPPAEAAGNREIPFRVAQAATPIANDAAGPQPTPQRLIPAQRVPIPSDVPMNEDEKRGWRMKTKADALQDPYMQKQAQDLITYGAGQRKQQYDAIMQDFRDKQQEAHQRQMAEEEFKRGEEQRKLEMAQKRQTLEQSAIAPRAPGAPAVQVAGPGGSLQTDPRLGTLQSPQRTGVPELPPVPPGMTPKQHAEQYAPIVTQNVQAALKAEPEFQKALDLVKVIQNHPGREMGLGFGSSVMGQIPGTAAYGFHRALAELQGKEFLQAYSSLRGGGSIANKEGESATNAMIARVNSAQNKEEFDSALNDLEKNLRTDLETAQRKVNRPVTAWRGGDNPETAPDIGQRATRRGRLVEYIGGNPGLDASYRPLQ
jgi:hypothetical protein